MTVGRNVNASTDSLLLIKFASSEEFVGDGARQRASAARKRRNFLQVESDDLC